MIIYKATNLINNKIYIGLTTKTLGDRINGHRAAMKNCNYAIYRAMRKYGFENFQFKEIDKAENIDDLINLEFKYIIEFKSMDPKIGYNMMAQNDSIKYFNDDTRAKISESINKRHRSRTPEEKLILSFNMTNAHQGIKFKDCTSEYIGVRKFPNGSYNFTIKYRYKSYSKNFKNEVDCAKAYDIFAIYLFGESAKINFEEKREYYINLDLESVVDKILSTHSFGRKGKKGYDFNDLPFNVRPAAISNLTEFIKNKIIDNKMSEFLIKISFHYNGEIFLNSTEFSELDNFLK